MSTIIRTIHRVTTVAGIAGQRAIHAHLTVEIDGVPTDSIETFTGSEYGAPGPVVYLYGDQQVIVTEPSRFGERFDEAWVRAFYAPNAWGTPTGHVDAAEYCPSCERDNREGHYDNCQRVGAPTPEPAEAPDWVKPCGNCGTSMERYRGMTYVYCGKCGAEHNAGGQRLRDDWRGNPSAWDEDVSDLDGYETQHAGD